MHIISVSLVIIIYFIIDTRYDIEKKWFRAARISCPE
jgi:hypothetical protein